MTATTPLYLPLTEGQLACIEQDASSINGLPSATAAALILIQRLPSTSAGQSLKQIEQVLAKLVGLAWTMDCERRGQFAEAACKGFDAGAFKAGLSRAAELGIRLIDDDALLARNYLSGGQWNCDFSATHHQSQSPLTTEVALISGDAPIKLMSEQARNIITIQSELDESLHIQALAGCGKTAMVGATLRMLERWSPLLLAMTQPQLIATQQRAQGLNYKAMTFGQFSDFVLAQDTRTGVKRAGYRSKLTYNVDNAEAAQSLGFLPVGNKSPAEVASLCRRTVMAFCYSTAKAISEEHLPAEVAALDHVARSLLCAYAERFWSETLCPTVKPALPSRGYHRMKALSLSEWASVGPSVSHIILDEAHDLPAPLAQFLDACGKPVLSFGDNYQRLDGAITPRTGALRQREMFQSFRAGKEVETVINPLIENNPLVRAHPLVGNQQASTKVYQYSHQQIPERPCTILVADNWGLLDWVQRLAYAGLTFEIIGSAQQGLTVFVMDCLSLYQNGVRPRSSELFRYQSWDAIHRDLARKSKAFNRIHKLFEQGYSYQAFELTMNSVQPPTDNSDVYRVGLAADARNHEYNVVYLAEDLLTKPAGEAGGTKALSRLYVGGTRAKHELFIPGDLLGWVQDLGAKIVSDPMRGKPRP